MNPLVSIGVPIYNVESYIRRCAKSLFEQTYDNIEYIFVDDCTPDESINILQEVLDEYPNRKNQTIFLRNAENSGVSATRNMAINSMTGQFVMWVDSDDFIEPDMVEKLVMAQRNNDADIVTCNVVVDLPNGRTRIMRSPVYGSAYDMTIQLLQRNAPVSLWARLIKRALYTRHHIKCLNGIDNGEDYQVMPRLTYYAKNVVNIPNVLYHYNCQNQTSYTACYSVKQSEQVIRSVHFLETFFKDKGCEYMDALGCAKIQILARDLVKCCRFSLKAHYYRTLRMAKQLDPKYKRSLSVPFRLIFMMPGYHTAKIYVMLASLFK